MKTEQGGNLEKEPNPAGQKGGKMPKIRRACPKGGIPTEALYKYRKNKKGER
ncbi:MAG: hypothetical protein U9O96_06695 [Candidatus Thermoplasmatota archaeon]|nr:hypothetical protein [Candidatus Thermoplasmatota archaeon]